MAEFPEDLPRLWTIEVTWNQLGRSCLPSDHGLGRHLADYESRAEVAGVGILHEADCWMAKGDRLTIREVQQLRRSQRRRIEHCDVCLPDKQQSSTPPA